MRRRATDARDGTLCACHKANLGSCVGKITMPQFKLHWIKIESKTRQVLNVENMAATNSASAQRKAMALFDDGGAIHGANRIELYDEGGDEPFWTHP
jgi:hypothetical protein